MTWQTDAACVGTDPDTFYPNEHDRRAVDAAKKVCVACPVARECLEWALSLHGWEDHGVLGGLAAGERAAMRRASRSTRRRWTRNASGAS